MPGSDDLGAVSVGISEPMIGFLLVAVPMLVVNIMTRRMKNHQAPARRLQRTHLILTLAFGAVVLLFGGLYNLAFERSAAAFITTVRVFSVLWWGFLGLQAVFAVWAVRCFLNRHTSTT